jgi:hypothetical protein
MTPQDVPAINSRKTLAQPAVMRSARRWWWGVLAGSLLALPLSWLLSYAAALPFFLGLFFFMLFGVIIGAGTYRVASRAAPVAPSAVIVGTTFLIALTMGVSLVKEAHDFPDDVAHTATRRTRDLGGRSAEQFRAAVASDVRIFLSERYGPGPIWGYIRWALKDGSLRPGDIPTLSKPISVPAAQTKWWWAARVVASLALLSFGIASQTFALRDSQRMSATDLEVQSTQGLVSRN